MSSMLNFDLQQPRLKRDGGEQLKLEIGESDVIYVVVPNVSGAIDMSQTDGAVTSGRPTKLACEQASFLLAGFGKPLPSGDVSTNSSGGLQLEWVRDLVRVHLTIPGTCEGGQGSIYHKMSGDCGTEVATVQALAHWMSKITD